MDNTINMYKLDKTSVVVKVWEFNVIITNTHMSDFISSNLDTILLTSDFSIKSDKFAAFDKEVLNTIVQMKREMEQNDI